MLIIEKMIANKEKHTPINEKQSMKNDAFGCNLQTEMNNGGRRKRKRKAGMTTAASFTCVVPSSKSVHSFTLVMAGYKAKMRKKAMHPPKKEINVLEYFRNIILFLFFLVLVPFFIFFFFYFDICLICYYSVFIL